MMHQLKIVDSANKTIEIQRIYLPKTGKIEKHARERSSALVIKESSGYRMEQLTNTMPVSEQMITVSKKTDIIAR